MPKYQVTIECTRTEVYEVEAEFEDEAEDLVLSGEYDTEVETVNSDYEVSSTVLIGEREPIKVGDEVEMPEPEGNDDHKFSFVGNVTDITDGWAIVEDQDTDVFGIEVERLKRYPE